MSYLYNDSEVKCFPYLTIKRDVPSGATELTHKICCSVAFLCSMTQRKRRKASHLFMSIPNRINLVPMRAARARCPGPAMPESLTCPMSKCMILLQCLLILARHRWKKEKKKVASCIPRRRLEATHFPHTARGKGRNISET